jgi:hypothetical protein
MALGESQLLVTERLYKYGLNYSVRGFECTNLQLKNASALSNFARLQNGSVLSNFARRDGPGSHGPSHRTARREI